MSDLIEKTAKAIEAEIAKRKGVFDSGDLSRAAIAAVAEWLQADGDFYAGIVGIRVERQLALPTPPEVK
jgi:hypothetical protein